MELEEMQNAWNSLSHRAEKQDALTNKLLEKVTQHRYHAKLNKIRYPEFVGTLVCYAGAAYVSVHLPQLEATHLQLMAWLSVGLLLLLPILSLASVRAMQRVSISSATYVETIHTFGQQMTRFQTLQKINICLALVLMLVCLPVLAAIQGKDLTQIPYFWSGIFPLFALATVAFAFWVLKAYQKTLLDLKNLLSDTSN